LDIEAQPNEQAPQTKRAGKSADPFKKHKFYPSIYSAASVANKTDTNVRPLKPL